MENGVSEIVARKVELLETMVREFTNTATSLAQEIAREEERTKIKDPNHVAYSTLAKALAARRGNLLVSITDLETRLRDARRQLEEARSRVSVTVGENQEKVSSSAPRAA